MSYHPHNLGYVARAETLDMSSYVPQGGALAGRLPDVRGASSRAKDSRLSLAPATRSRLLGYHGAPQTVGLIRENIRKGETDLMVRGVAEFITQDLSNKDVTAEILAIYYWVLNRTRYTSDPTHTEFVRTAPVMLKQILAGRVPGLDCDDMTVLIGALAASIGRHVRAMTVAFAPMMFRGERQYSHVFTSVQEPRTKQWIVCDPVAGDQTRSMLARVSHAKVWPMA